MANLLSKDFNDQDRYDTIRNPVATTLIVSFRHISRDMPLAAEYLKSICYLAERDIPGSLFGTGDDELAADEAIGTLIAYAFISAGKAKDGYNIHRLVR